MVFFTVVIYVLLFALCLGAILAVLVYVPLFIYAIPYCWWVGTQNIKGEMLDRKKEPFMQTVKNAHVYYKSKRLAKKEPNA